MGIIKIGHAVQSETNSHNGAVGDQTGKEVLIADWYNRSKGWTTVFRAKSEKDAETIAKTMEAICANDKIGYGQDDRTTSYNQAKKNNWDITKIKTKCNTDCSEAVGICCNAAGIPISSSIYTGNEKELLEKTKKFNIFTSKEYLESCDLLMRGDILLGPGHTAIVLENGSKVNKKVKTINYEISGYKAESFSPNFAGAYKVNASSLNIRKGPGTEYDVVVTLPKDTEIYCQGYYKTIASNKYWLQINFIYKDIYYLAYCNGNYITRQE